MSVLIKGMEMPDGCVVCPFFIENRHDRGDDSLCRASGKEAKCGCPLIEIPPHGRLIDADKIGLTDFEIILCQKGNPFKNALEMLFEKINNAPTVIETEGGE